MNFAKKIYCRSVQTCLRAALPILPYRDPEILSGIEELPALLHRQKIGSVLLVTDPGVRTCGLTLSLERLLRESAIHCVIYDQTVANPTDENVEQARQLYLSERCQALIGFGGGSSIDCAKAVGARIAKPGQPLRKMEGVLRVHHRLPPLIAIPTTSGTGSEVTLAAVITDSKTHHKYPITDFSLIPRYAVLDPEITRSLPRHLTACTAMDALTHAVEAYIGKSTTKQTRADAEEAVRLIFSNLDSAYQNGADMDARRNLLQAAYLAGRAFSKSYVGYVHAVAHSLSGKYNLPHGYANAVLLPKVLSAYGECIYDKLARLAVIAGIAEKDEQTAAAAQAFIRAVFAMNHRFGLPETFKELKRSDIPELARTADREGNPLYPVPVLMDAQELETLYESVLEDTHESRRSSETDCRPENVLCLGKDTSRKEQDRIPQAS